jgi:proteic killer suppression protein
MKGGWMIVSFGDRQTEDLYHGRQTAKSLALPNDVQRIAHRKLDMLNVASNSLDLRSPPGNRLEALKGNLRGYYSMRINDQWRLIFRFENSNVYDVKMTDYH